jgi:hypothetical protein
MRNPTALETLSAKVALLVEKYNRVKNENIILSKELAEAKKTIEEQSQEIIRLQEDEELRLMKIEEITQKIMEVAMADDDISIKNEYKRYETKRDYVIPNSQITPAQLVSSVDEVENNNHREVRKLFG